jgi:geranylgeranyl diphosphate synthase type II
MLGGCVTDTSQVLATLVDYRQRVLDALLQRLPNGKPGRYLYDLLPAYPRRLGKGLRPALVLATCGAFHGDEEDALPFAVGIELLHNAFLVHDDIQDGSRLRRGRLSLPAEYGTGLALCAGDALALEALAVFREAADRLPVRSETVMAEVETAVRRTIEGQAIELGWERDRRLDVTASDYLDMVLHKTSWYSVILPCRLGVLAAGLPLGPERFLRFGSLTGAVLQIGDDLLSLITEADQSGKDWGDDVLEGKRSLPVIHFLLNAPEHERRRMSALLAAPRDRRRREDAHWVVELLNRRGSLDFALRCAQALAIEARAELMVELGLARISPYGPFLDGVVSALASRCTGIPFGQVSEETRLSKVPGGQSWSLAEDIV